MKCYMSEKVHSHASAKKRDKFRVNCCVSEKKVLLAPPADQGERFLLTKTEP